MPDNNIPQILIQPLKPALIAGMAQKLQVLVRVQAPDAAPAENKLRKPYHLALVIDRSGSMSGPPLVEAVRCARHMIDRLEPTDRASLVVFDDRVRTLAPAQPVGDRRTLYNALAIRLINDYLVEGDGVMPVIRLPDIAFGAEAWALVELEIPAGLAATGAASLLQAAVTAATPEGIPIAFIDATLTLDAVAPAVWEALLADALVVTRRAELDAGRLLEQARQAAEYGDWAAIERLLAEARQRFADQPWLIEVLANMAEIAKSMDAARFKKEALYSSRRMGSRLAAKEELLAMSLDEESAKASFLRRKTAQGKAQFDKPDDSQK